MIFSALVPQMFYISHHGSSFQIKDIKCNKHLSTGHHTKEISKQLFRGVRDKVKGVKGKFSASGTQAKQSVAGEPGPFTLQIWQEAVRVREHGPAHSSDKNQLIRNRQLKLPLQFHRSCLPRGSRFVNPAKPKLLYRPPHFVLWSFTVDKY